MTAQQESTLLPQFVHRAQMERSRMRPVRPPVLTAPVQMTILDVPLKTYILEELELLMLLSVEVKSTFYFAVLAQFA